MKCESWQKQFESELVVHLVSARNVLIQLGNRPGAGAGEAGADADDGCTGELGEFADSAGGVEAGVLEGATHFVHIVEVVVLTMVETVDVT